MWTKRPPNMLQALAAEGKRPIGEAFVDRIADAGVAAWSNRVHGSVEQRNLRVVKPGVGLPQDVHRLARVGREPTQLVLVLGQVEVAPPDFPACEAHVGVEDNHVIGVD
jgi:hypothetical protein